jgi:hypothetical protein
MKQCQNEENSAFFKALPNVRESSPDRFCGKTLISSSVNISNCNRPRRIVYRTCLARQGPRTPERDGT